MKHLYRLEDIGYNYQSDFSLNNINVEIEKSKITGLVGPNGSGKTTLLNILSFLDFPHSGDLLYNNILLRRNNISHLRKNIAYVQQYPYIFKGTVYDNVEIGLKINHINTEKRAKVVTEILSLFNIEYLSNRLANTLSGGEAKKVAVAQAMALNPDVLIMDEPFSNLDDNSVLDLHDIILSLKSNLNKTIILTTHDQIIAQRITDRVYTIINGKLFPAHLLNLYNGKCIKNSTLFNTGKILINLAGGIEKADYVAIDPTQIVLSHSNLNSSMRNSFNGKIVSMVEEDSNIKLNIDIEEKIQAIITMKAFEELGLSLGQNVWVSFKSTSVAAF